MRNKPVAVVGASTGGFGAVWAQAELRKVLGAPMGARVTEGRSWRWATPLTGSMPNGRAERPNLVEQVREVAGRPACRGRNPLTPSGSPPDGAPDRDL